MVDLVRCWLGDIAQVSAFYHWREPGVGPEPMNLPHAYDVNYRFDSGVTGSFTTSRVLTNVSAGHREVLVVCDDALIEWSAAKVVENGETVWEEEAEGRAAFALQAEAFVAAVRAADPAATLSPYGPSLNSLAAVLGANASAERDGGAPGAGGCGVGRRRLESALRGGPRRAGAGGVRPLPDRGDCRDYNRNGRPSRRRDEREVCADSASSPIGCPTITSQFRCYSPSFPKGITSLTKHGPCLEEWLHICICK